MNNKGIGLCEVILVIAATVVFVGALFLVNSNDRVKSETSNSAIVKDAHYTEFRTDDGVRCIFYKRGYGGGLSCDWSE